MSKTEATTGRAIVLFSRTWQALTCIRSLGLRGIDVIAADEFSITPGSLSKFSSDSFEYANPMADPEQFLQDISDAVDRYAPDEGVPYVLIPTQRDTRLLAEHAERFSDRIALAAPPYDLIQKVSDKGWLASYADEQGLAVPKTLYPASAEELEAQLEPDDLPVVVKIRSGIGGIGLHLCHSKEEAVAAFADLVGKFDLEPDQYPIVQEAVDGDDYCVCTIAENGEAKGVTTYQNVGKLSGGGPGTVRETVPAAAAEAAAAQLIDALQWHGVAQLDFVWTGKEEDPAYLIELNARLFAGLFQIVASGVDYPWLLFQMASGHPIPDDLEPQLGVRTETPVLGLLSTFKEIADELNPGSQLELAWKAASGVWQQGNYVDAVQLWLSELSASNDAEDRFNRVKAMLESREDNICEFFDSDDPHATLGLLYPVVAYLKYGKLSSDILTGLRAP